MENPLITHLRKYITITDKDAEEVLDFFEFESYAKKENLLRINQVCKHHYFVLNGCLRMFFIDEKGKEQTLQFAIENWWLTEYMAFEKASTTEFTIQAVEATEVLGINLNNQDKLLEQFPQLERYFRIIYQRAYAASLFRTKYLFDFSREALYHHFNDNFPNFSQRIPQHLLASYLNMTPEYLSEIKKKNFLKPD